MIFMKNQESFHEILLHMNIGDVIRILHDTCNYLKDVKLIPRDINDGGHLLNPLYVDGNIISIHEKYYPKLTEVHGIFGIDASVYPVAESKDGFVVAVAGAIIKEEDNKKNIALRYGPILSYLSKNTIKDIKKLYPADNRILHLALSNIVYAKKLVLKIFEGHLVVTAIKLGKERDIILIDGPLDKYITILNSISPPRIIAGLVKKSKLLRYFPELTEEIVSSPLPIVIPIYNLLKGMTVAKTVDVHLGKFSMCGMPLRIDIYNKYDDSNRDFHHYVFDAIYTSSYELTGYPNALKEAHILSKISRSELISIKIKLYEYGAKIDYSPKIRDFLFGPYNKSPSEWVTDNVNI